MPLDDFQVRVLRTLMMQRSPESVFAGGSVLQRHGHRLSDDYDIFHDSGTDVGAIASRDITALIGAGLQVDVALKYEGLVEADVWIHGHTPTKIQWVEAGAHNFFAPVPDSDFGWRLHMADLCVNKVLAAGGRRRVRDYVDLVLIHEHIMPLWHAAWAAPGKDSRWSPKSLIEKIAMTNRFQQDELEDDVLSTIALSAGHVGQIVGDAIEEARNIMDRLPDSAAGHLFIDEQSHLISDVDRIYSGDYQILSVTHGGTWPSGPDIDRELILRVIDEFGEDGSRYTGADPSSFEPC